MLERLSTVLQNAADSGPIPHGLRSFFDALQGFYHRTRLKPDFPEWCRGLATTFHDVFEVMSGRRESSRTLVWTLAYYLDSLELLLGWL